MRHAAPYREMYLGLAIHGLVLTPTVHVEYLGKSGATLNFLSGSNA